MALIFMDGFDKTNSNSKYAFAGYTNFNTGGIHENYSRFGGYGVLIQNGSVRKDNGVNKTTLCIGLAVRQAAVATPTNKAFIIFYDESGVKQIEIRLTSDYSLAAYRDTTLLGTSSAGVFSSTKWNYIELKATISATVGVVEVRVNENQVLNLTSQNTKNGSDYIRYVYFTNLTGLTATWFDDFYIDDAQFHGDCRVRIFMPDADGNSADFTRSTGSNDYECVDELPSNDDTDYISSDTLNHKSIFGITTGAVGTVKGVQLVNNVRVDEAGVRKIKPVIRSNSTDYQGTESPEITADYTFESEIWELDPDDSAAWTQTKIEAAEFGLEITT